MNTPIANVEALQIGSVDFVSPDEIKVVLDLDAPHDVALNSGTPRPFPRINSYVLIAGEGGYLVAQINWITIERSQFPKRRGIQDFGVLDLPYPLRKMSIIPLGVLKEMLDTENNSTYEFSRGIETFPTVGDPVLLPTHTQLKAIVESGENRRVDIGISPLAGNAVVSVDPDRLFGRHLAVLGNTGSGKSCSVAGLLRWSIEAAKRPNGDIQNSHFIVLDPNGEYAKSFGGLSNVRVYGAEATPKAGMEQLVVPLWLWNSAEWAAFVQASGKAQRPTLVQALRSVREGDVSTEKISQAKMRSYIRSILIENSNRIKEGTPWKNGGWGKGYSEALATWKKGVLDDEEFTTLQRNYLADVNDKIESVLKANTSTNLKYAMFPRTPVEDLQESIEKAYVAFGGTPKALPIDADIPRPFDGDDFLRCIEANAEMMGTSEYIETMLFRIRALMSDAKLKPVISPDKPLSLAEWLDKYVFPSNNNGGSITVIDLSLLPAEITHLIASVFARMALECLQRYRRQHNGKILPTVLVMEEAHTFIKRYDADSENETATAMCTKVFEKIAREGRKYGLGLVLSSQRPSELSPTVISQCNSFLLHRLSNDRDQELVGKLVPDNLRGLLRELPSLPSRNAILLGWASELPVLVRMKFLEKNFRPQSDDPKFWDAWTGEAQKVNWDEIAKTWQNYSSDTDNTIDEY